MLGLLICSLDLCTVGFDKANKMKVYDLGSPSTEPVSFQGEQPIRFATYHQDDNVILSTYVDKPNIRCSCQQEQQPVMP